MKEMEWMKARPPRFTSLVDAFGLELSLLPVSWKHMVLGGIFWRRCLFLFIVDLPPAHDFCLKSVNGGSTRLYLCPRVSEELYEGYV